MSQAIARGMAMGLASAPFCVQRWEEGWDRPLADWRRELGLHDPLRDESYALRRQLADLPVEL
jgi:ubiquinone biosynthesis protein Coq4